MQAFKIKNYEREHGIGTFVPFRHLTGAEASFVRETLRKSLKLTESVSPRDIVQVVYERSIPVNEVNAEKSEFNLLQLLNRLGFGLAEAIYLNWYHYDDIDEIQSGDIITKFSDIWYPASDDLDLIDPKMRWVLSVNHSGTVRALNLNRGISKC